MCKRPWSNVCYSETKKYTLLFTYQWGSSHKTMAAAIHFYLLLLCFQHCKQSPTDSPAYWNIHDAKDYLTRSRKFIGKKDPKWIWKPILLWKAMNLTATWYKSKHRVYVFDSFKIAVVWSMPLLYGKNLALKKHCGSRFQCNVG